MKLLNEENAKTIKGEDLGFKTEILYLAPSTESGVMNTCEYASPLCAKNCIFFTGRAQLDPEVIAARIRRTEFLHSDRQGFMDQLRHEIRLAMGRAEREGMKLAVRLNGTSDLYWMPKQLASEFPCQFYDYTKLPRPWSRTLPNYHLTFSLSESNWPDAKAALDHGVNVAVVFDTKKGQTLPSEWRGYPVLDGDEHDLRFLNGYNASIIGLRAKGPAKKGAEGFVQLAGTAYFPWFKPTTGVTP